MQNGGFTIGTVRGCLTLEFTSSFLFTRCMQEYFEVPDQTEIPSIMEIDYRFIEYFRLHMMCCEAPECHRRQAILNFIGNLELMLGQKLYILDKIVTDEYEYQYVRKIAKMINEGYYLRDIEWLMSNNFIQI